HEGIQAARLAENLLQHTIFLGADFLESLRDDGPYEIVLALKPQVDRANRDVASLADLQKREVLASEFEHQPLGRLQHALERRLAPPLLRAAANGFHG